VQAFASLDDMLAGSALDAVVVALPTALHGAAARAVFQAGCDLYLEKPLAADATDGAAVLELWRRSGRIGMMGFNARFNPLQRRLRDLIRAGRAGTPVYVHSAFATAQRPMPEWKQSRATGGGVLLDLGCHHIDLMRFLFGREPIAVRATLSSRSTEDDTAFVELELRGGPQVHSFFSLAAAEQDHVEVHGDRGRLSVSRFTSLDVAVSDNPGPGNTPLRRLARRAGEIRQIPAALRARRAPLREPGYATALDRFLEAVTTRRLAPDAPDLDDGYACLTIIEAAERSAKSGRVETLA
jgi:predicted dehydrogenase